MAGCRQGYLGRPLTNAELAVFTSITGLTEAPTAPCKEAWLIFRRRGGKDVKAASYATWLAAIGAGPISGGAS